MLLASVDMQTPQRASHELPDSRLKLYPTNHSNKGGMMDFELKGSDDEHGIGEVTAFDMQAGHAEVSYCQQHRIIANWIANFCSRRKCTDSSP